jgi:hypothetical protein
VTNVLSEEITVKGTVLIAMNYLFLTTIEENSVFIDENWKVDFGRCSAYVETRSGLFHCSLEESLKYVKL